MSHFDCLLNRIPNADPIVCGASLLMAVPVLYFGFITARYDIAWWVTQIMLIYTHYEIQEAWSVNSWLYIQHQGLLDSCQTSIELWNPADGVFALNCGTALHMQYKAASWKNYICWKQHAQNRTVVLLLPFPIFFDLQVFHWFRQRLLHLYLDDDVSKISKFRLSL